MSATGVDAATTCVPLSVSTHESTRLQQQAPTIKGLVFFDTLWPSQFLHYVAAQDPRALQGLVRFLFDRQLIIPLHQWNWTGIDSSVYTDVVREHQIALHGADGSLYCQAGWMPWATRQRGMTPDEFPRHPHDKDTLLTVIGSMLTMLTLAGVPVVYTSPEQYLSQYPGDGVPGCVDPHYRRVGMQNTVMRMMKMNAVAGDDDEEMAHEESRPTNRRSTIHHDERNVVVAAAATSTAAADESQLDAPALIRTVFSKESCSQDKYFSTTSSAYAKMHALYRYFLLVQHAIASCINQLSTYTQSEIYATNASHTRDDAHCSSTIVPLNESGFTLHILHGVRGSGLVMTRDEDVVDTAISIHHRTLQPHSKTLAETVAPPPHHLITWVGYVSVIDTTSLSTIRSYVSNLYSVHHAMPSSVLSTGCPDMAVLETSVLDDMFSGTPSWMKKKKKRWASSTEHKCLAPSLDMSVKRRKLTEDMTDMPSWVAAMNATSLPESSTNTLANRAILSRNNACVIGGETLTTADQLWTFLGMSQSVALHNVYDIVLRAASMNQDYAEECEYDRAMVFPNTTVV